MQYSDFILIFTFITTYKLHCLYKLFTRNNYSIELITFPNLRNMSHSRRLYQFEMCIWGNITG